MSAAVAGMAREALRVVEKRRFRVVLHSFSESLEVHGGRQWVLDATRCDCALKVVSSVDEVIEENNMVCIFYHMQTFPGSLKRMPPETGPSGLRGRRIFIHDSRLT